MELPGGVGLSPAVANLLAQYSNRDPDTNKPDPTIGHPVRAEITMRTMKGWAGPGGVPTDDLGSDDASISFHTRDRWRQGIVLEFVGYGSHYTFNFVAAVMAIVVGSV